MVFKPPSIKTLIWLEKPHFTLFKFNPMTKVYGTGVYDFRRHRVAEYPVDGEAPPVPEKPTESRPLSNVPSSITLSEIQRDRLTRIAAENWMKTADSAPTKPFSPDLVKEIYSTELTVKGICRCFSILSYLSLVVYFLGLMWL